VMHNLFVHAMLTCIFFYDITFSLNEEFWRMLIFFCEPSSDSSVILFNSKEDVSLDYANDFLTNLRPSSTFYGLMMNGIFVRTMIRAISIESQRSFLNAKIGSRLSCYMRLCHGCCRMDHRHAFSPNHPFAFPSNTPGLWCATWNI
jgi:hypothetical protein